ncbi:MAG TPA: thermonuclease family protein [Sphingobium sp.]|nr:thermonuclease family protein [Sphingobium sp.]
MTRWTFWIRRWLRRLGALLLLAVLLAIAGLMRGPEDRLTDAGGARVYVQDGDSLRIANRAIRIEGMDAVELHQLCRARDGAQWPCGIEARDALTALVARGQLVCTARASDRFGRALARCSVAGERDIAANMVAQGWAVSGDGRAAGRYRAEQEAARQAQRGIWRGSFERPGAWRAAHPRTGT